MSFDSVTFSCGVAVMAKASEPGTTKTRLCPPLTSSEAAAFNTSFLQDVAANLVQAARRAPLVPYMAYAPAGSERFFRSILPPSLGLIESRIGHLGECLLRAIEDQLDQGNGGACVLNADSPTLPPDYLVQAAQALAEPGERAVIGPAVDGGYYLLAMKAPHRRLFEDITWSTGHVFNQTMARAAEIGLPVHVLPAWYDVDDVASLRLLCGELFENRSFAADAPPAGRAIHTKALMRKLLDTADLRARVGRCAGAAA